MKRALCLPILIGLLLTAGCAVTRIDVDVYKGPLANDEDVQIQQFAAMAIGAKPLLIQLRDRLEWGKDFGVEIQKNSGWYKTDFVPPPAAFDEGQGGWFRNHHARSVNNLLSLYKDTIRNDLNQYIEDGFVALSRYRNAHALAAPDETADEKSWRGLSAKMRDFQEPTKQAQLKQAWGLFLYPDGFKEVDPRPAKWDYRRSSGLQQLLNEAELDPQKILTVRVGPDRPSWHVNLYFLRERAVVERHADVLFDEEEAEASRLFVKVVTERVNAIFARREAISSLWRTANRAGHYLGSPAFTETAAYKNTGGEVLRNRMIEPVSELIATTTNLLNLRYLLWSPNFVSAEEDLHAELSAALGVEETPAVWGRLGCTTQGVERVPDDWYETANGNLALAFRRETLHEPEKHMGQEAGDLASLLIRADAWLIKQASMVPPAMQAELAVKCTKANSTDEDIRNVPIIGVEFGLARNLGGDLEDKLVIGDASAFGRVVRIANSVAEGAAAGLEGGRLRPGIRTLIERYVDATDEFPRNSELIAQRRQLLSEALVRFAEKVLIIANYDVLLRDQTGAARAQTEPELSNAGFYLPSGSSGETDFKGIRKYTRVLQAVGNTITVQANELIVRARYNREIEADTNREIRGLKEALNIPPEEYLAGLIADLSGERDRITALAVATTTAFNLAEIWHKAVKVEELSEAAWKGWVLTAKVVKGPDALPQDTNMTGLQKLDERFKTIVPQHASVTTQAVLRDKMVALLNDEASKQSLANTAHRASGNEPSARAKDRGNRMKSAGMQLAAVANGQLGKPVDVSTDAKLKVELGKIVKIVDDLATAELGKLTGLQAAIRKSLETLDTALVALKFDRTAMASGKVLQALKDAAALLTAKKARLVDTVAVLGTIQDSGGLGLGAKGGADLTANQVHVKLLALVEKQEAAAAPGSEAKRQNANARAALISIPAPLSPALAEIDDARNSKDVMDQLLSALRHEHVQAIRQYGEDSSRAEQLAQAVHAAEIHRSGMAYIRPSAVYLKSSYPAATLQGDPGLGWNNMLQRHALRALPFVGEIFGGIMEGPEDIKIQSEIDKQFWQTINSVRVSGAGNTNYVMAKDDIGNWYVKTYSADPKDIINSAKNLALFGLGGQLNTNLLAGGTGPGESGADPGDAQKAQTSTVLDQFQKQYNDSAVEAYDALVKDLESETIADSISSAWAANPCEKETGLCGPSALSDALSTLRVANGPLKTAAAAMKKAVAKLDAELPAKGNGRETAIAFEKGDQIVVGLNATRRFHNALAAQLRNLNLTGDATNTAQEMLAAKKSADSDLKAKEEDLAKAEKRLDDAVSQGLGTTDESGQNNLGTLVEDKNKAKEERDSARTAASDADKAYREAQSSFDKAQAAEGQAMATVRQIVGDYLDQKIKARVTAVEELERSVIVLGRTVAAQGAANDDNTPEAAPTVPAAASGLETSGG